MAAKRPLKLIVVHDLSEYAFPRLIDHGRQKAVETSTKKTYITKTTISLIDHGRQKAVETCVASLTHITRSPCLIDHGRQKAVET